jgi:hypothetical protein
MPFKYAEKTDMPGALSALHVNLSPQNIIQAALGI